MTQVPLLNCGRCGSEAREDEGVSVNVGPAPVRFRCKQHNCLAGPHSGDRATALHAWNRVTQGWLAMDVLFQIGKSIPELEPQITKAMMARWEAVQKAEPKATEV